MNHGDQTSQVSGQPIRPRPVVAVVFLLAAVPFANAAHADTDPNATSNIEHRTSNISMSVPQSIVLGIVEGLTEYLPVSSTGHLLITQKAMGIGTDSEQAKEAADAYAICIQAGAIVAVLGLYWRRVGQVFKGFAGRDRDGLNLFTNLMAGFVPAAVIGLLFNDTIKAYLFSDWPIVIAWFVGGALILAVAWRRKARGAEPRSGKTLEQLTWRLALVIGFAQCIAMWPGVSRSLITIVGGVLVGLSLPAAVEFSFLLGVVTLGAATCYDALKHGELMLATYSPLTLAVGLVAAFISALLAVKWMVAYLNRHGMEVFGYYRIAIAIIVAALLLGGWL
jgi:undecaprenyl-diphosphatase